jgi:hypothetical protein
MAATQLSFSIRTTSAAKTVHLIGSWDGYQGQIPLSKDSKGSWKGTFRFQTNILVPGQRYWFYYMLDGYQVTHDPSAEYTKEPTTGRKLNILDVPVSKDAAAKRAIRRQSRAVPQGRAISPSNIKCPKPQRPGQTKHIVDGAYTQATLAALNARFAEASLDDSEEDDSEDDEDESDDDSDVPSLTSGSSRSSCSSPSSVSSGSSCSCERYGITRSGHRVKLDCGGSRCGYSDDSCSESEEESFKRAQSTRRHGVVIRG